MVHRKGDSRVRILRCDFQSPSLRRFRWPSRCRRSCLSEPPMTSSSAFPEYLVEIREIRLTLATLDRLVKQTDLRIRDAAVQSAILRPFNQFFGADLPRFQRCLVSGIVLLLNSPGN